jgi:type I restriction enzyme S subunit
MAKDGRSTATPRLRFPEFRHAEPWQRRKLSDFLVERKERNRQLTYGPQEVLSVSGEYGCVNQITLLGRSYAGASVKDYHVVETGDIVYTKSPLRHSPFGIIKENKGRAGIVSTLYAVYYPTALAHPTYLDHYFSHEHCLNSYLQRLVKKGAKNDMKVNNTAVLGGDIFAPELEEQRKIAACLTSLDELVAAQRRRVKTLNDHRRGLMQQLFPHEGEARPRLRFPAFTNKSLWHTQKVSSLLSKASEPVSVRPETLYREIGIRSHGKGIFHKEPVSGTVIGSKRVFHVVESAFTVNIVFAWEQAVGTTSKAEAGMIASHRFPMYVAKAGKCDVRYIKDFFLTPAGKHLLGLASPGGAGRNRTLGQKEFDNLDIALPETVGEQTRIADCLASLNTTIAAESDTLDTLKTHKTGLMQMLFPMPEDTQ